MNFLRFSVFVAISLFAIRGCASFKIPESSREENDINAVVDRQTQNCDVFQRSLQFGSPTGGTFFDDSCPRQNLSPLISRIDISVGGVIDQIIVTYSDGVRISHGQPGRTDFTVTLDSGEFITAVSGRSGNLVDQLSFTSNIRTYGPFGSNGGSPFSVDFGGCALLYIFGGAGRSMDSIGFGYGPL